MVGIVGGRDLGELCEYKGPGYMLTNCTHSRKTPLVICQVPCASARLEKWDRGKRVVVVMLSEKRLTEKSVVSWCAVRESLPQNRVKSRSQKQLTFEQ